jgi:hypothetical protein
VAARWIWGDSARAGAPAAGETIAVYRKFTVEQPLRSAGAVITCDNEFTLLVNGQLIAKDSDWTTLETVSLSNALKQGENHLLVVAKNAGNAPNAAGLFMEVRMAPVAGESISISTDASWLYTSAPPKGQPRKWTLNKIDWRPVTVVPTIAPWKSAIDDRAGSQLAMAMSGGNMMVRASLLKSDFLMRSLGRPNRDQIVTSRPSELTTLEAIDLSNNQQLATALAAGGAKLASRTWRDTEQLVRFVFRASLTREPTADELSTLTEALGDSPAATQIEDMLWAICMTPEFFLVR